MKNKVTSIFSWVIVAWICKVFLSSLPYKFTDHPDTQHIFGTIGLWIQDTVAPSLGQWFIVNGAVAVGVVELIAALVLLSPLLMLVINKLNIMTNVPSRQCIHIVGGLLSSGVMAGAVFFHLITPLGVEVLHNGQSDGGSLFYAAVSILVLGLVLAAINVVSLRTQK